MPRVTEPNARPETTSTSHKPTSPPFMVNTAPPSRATPRKPTPPEPPPAAILHFPDTNSPQKPTPTPPFQGQEPPRIPHLCQRMVSLPSLRLFRLRSPLLCSSASHYLPSRRFASIRFALPPITLVCLGPFPFPVVTYYSLCHLSFLYFAIHVKIVIFRSRNEHYLHSAWQPFDRAVVQGCPKLPILPATIRCSPARLAVHYYHTFVSTRHFHELSARGICWDMLYVGFVDVAELEGRTCTWINSSQS